MFFTNCLDTLQAKSENNQYYMNESKHYPEIVEMCLEKDIAFKSFIKFALMIESWVMILTLVFIWIDPLYVIEMGETVI